MSAFSVLTDRQPMRLLSGLIDLVIRALPLLICGLILATRAGYLDRSATLPVTAARQLQDHEYYIEPISSLITEHLFDKAVVSGGGRYQ